MYVGITSIYQFEMQTDELDHKFVIYKKTAKKWRKIAAVRKIEPKNNNNNNRLKKIIKLASYRLVLTACAARAIARLEKGKRKTA